MGTVDYMAPEQALDTRSADARADIYSLGATFWYLVTAEPLYPGESIVQKLVAHQHASLRVLSEVRTDATSGIDGWLQKMIAKSPGDRFQSMDEVIQSLDGLRQQVSRHGDVAAPMSMSAPMRIGIASSPATIKLDQSLVDTATQSSVSIRIKTSPQIRSEPTSEKLARRLNPSEKLRLNRSWWLAAGSLPLLAIAAIVVIIRHRDGTETQIEVPEGATIEIVGSSPSIASSAPGTTPDATAPTSIEQMPPTAADSLPAVSEPVAETRLESPWEDLFNGNGTTAWSSLGPFRVQGKLLVANGGREITAISREQYTDFELEAVWKIGAGANSGIYYRNLPEKGNFVGNEYQIADHKSTRRSIRLRAKPAHCMV